MSCVIYTQPVLQPKFRVVPFGV